jgi:bifunctional DNA-binding transcriptional regulator/antitoxin component of YhaV-PrlF toxin-antitoxin module
MRDRLGLRPGDEVDFDLEDGAVRVRPVEVGQSLRGRFAGARLTELLEEDRRVETRR